MFAGDHTFLLPLSFPSQKLEPFPFHTTSNMKQKIVVRVEMHGDKCRTKALKVAASTYGVSKVSIEGTNKDLVEVIGEDVDSVCLARTLKKKVGFATIVKVEQVKLPGVVCYCTTSSCYVPINCAPPYRHYEVVRDYPESTCTIM